jgi:hypothetical protein
MPTAIEVRVMEILSAIEVPADAAKQIEAMGTEAVTVVCEAALGSYPGLRFKVRTNAAAMVAKLDHPQAAETLSLLINDASADIAVRALRGVARRQATQYVPEIAKVLRLGSTDPHAAAEAIQTLRALGTPEARAVLEAYTSAAVEQVPHRTSPVVRKMLETPPRPRTS